MFVLGLFFRIFNWFQFVNSLSLLRLSLNGLNRCANVYSIINLSYTFKSPNVVNTINHSVHTNWISITLYIGIKHSHELYVPRKLNLICTLYLRGEAFKTEIPRKMKRDFLIYWSLLERCSPACFCIIMVLMLMVVYNTLFLPITTRLVSCESILVQFFITIQTESSRKRASYVLALQTKAYGCAFSRAR